MFVLDRRFCDLWTTMLTLYECLVGGLDWDEVLEPLMVNVSPWMGALFCAYITLSLFLIMNLVSAIFVDTIIHQVREDKDEYIAVQISQLFTTEYQDRITLSDFIHSNHHHLGLRHSSLALVSVFWTILVHLV